MADAITNIELNWQGEELFHAQNEAGGEALLGGKNIRPMQMVLAALAGCTGVDVVLILNKKRVNFSDLKIKISGKRADTHPRVYTDIHVHYYVWGEDIKEKDVKQAIELSEEKYCSVSAMLRSTATIYSEYTILAPSEKIE